MYISIYITHQHAYITLYYLHTGQVYMYTVLVLKVKYKSQDVKLTFLTS